MDYRPSGSFKFSLEREGRNKRVENGQRKKYLKMCTRSRSIATTGVRDASPLATFYLFRPFSALMFFDISPLFLIECFINIIDIIKPKFHALASEGKCETK